MIPDGFRILVTYNNDKEVFEAKVPELGKAKVEGKTRAEALTKAEEAIEEAFRQSATEKTEMPTPLDGTEYSGELTVTVSPSVQRELVYLSNLESIEMNQLLAEIITAGVAYRICGVPGRQQRSDRSDQNQRGGRRRSGQKHRKSYHNIMDDQASFIEYVRGIESGGKRGGRGRSGGGNSGGGRGRSGGGRGRK